MRVIFWCLGRIVGTVVCGSFNYSIVPLISKGKDKDLCDGPLIVYIQYNTLSLILV